MFDSKKGVKKAKSRKVRTQEDKRVTGTVKELTSFLEHLWVGLEGAELNLDRSDTLNQSLAHGLCGITEGR